MAKVDQIAMTEVDRTQNQAVTALLTVKAFIDQGNTLYANQRWVKWYTVSIELDPAFVPLRVVAC